MCSRISSVCVLLSVLLVGSVGWSDPITLPYPDMGDVMVGKGYNMFTLNTTPASPFASSELRRNPINHLEMKISLIENSSDYSEAFSIGVSAGFEGYGFKISDAFEYADEHGISSKNITLIIKGHFIKHYESLANLSLIDDASNTLKNQGMPKFFEMYGHKYGTRSHITIADRIQQK